MSNPLSHRGRGRAPLGVAEWESGPVKRPDHDKPDSLNRARAMRHEATGPEKHLSSKLRNRQVANLKFRRQVWIGPCMADFFCAEAKLVIEVDGDTHIIRKKQDQKRSAWLASEGYYVLRFSNTDVMTNIDGVVQTILAGAQFRPSFSHSPSAIGPLPLPQGERRI